MIAPDQEEQRGVPNIFTIGLMEFLVWAGLLIAILIRQPAFIMLTFAILIIVNSTKIWSRFSPAKIEYWLFADKQQVFPGEKIAITMRIENRKFLPVWLQVIIPVESFFNIGSANSGLKSQGSLFWYQELHWKWELTALRRGWRQIGPPNLLSGDLLGFFQRPKPTNKLLMIVIYPRLVPLKAFFLQKMEMFGLVGSAGLVADPINLVGTKEYQSGSPAKYIHWKASARHDRLQEKLCEPTVQLKILLLIDVEMFGMDGAEEEFERTLEIMASLAYYFDNLGYPLGLVSNGTVARDGPAVLPVTHNPQQLPAVLESMAKLQFTLAGELSDILSRGVQLPWGISCILATNQLTEKSFIIKDFLAAHHIPTVFIVNQTSNLAGQLIDSPCFLLNEIIEGKKDGNN